ncbi:MAG: type II toxin-antitoxin system Phd/YefM family antitoxin [Myxococcales bacterium]|nr:type II toxin-antitoxin system Phd/YefM family antitoxin [Myxococcales bacterium]
MTWSMRDAKARFSELARRAEREGPQRVTRRGKAVLVVMSERDYASLVGRKPLSELLRNSPVAGLTLDLSRSRDF